MEFFKKFFPSLCRRLAKNPPHQGQPKETPKETYLYLVETVSVHKHQYLVEVDEHHHIHSLVEESSDFFGEEFEWYDTHDISESVISYQLVKDNHPLFTKVVI